MTDEQWLWLFVNQVIDNEENLEKMCDECRDEITSEAKKCIRCGKVLTAKADFVNPNFDAKRFEKLSHGDGIEYNEDVDVGLIKQLSKDGD